MLREAEDVDEDIEDMDGDAIGSGDDGEYLVGVSDDGKVVVIELDDGKPEDYAVLHASYDGEGPVTSMVFDGDAVYFTSESGLYKIDLPIIVAEWCWDGEDVVCYYDEDEGEAEDEDYMPLITYVGPADAGGTSGLVCGSLTFEETQPSYAPTPEAGLDLEPFDCTVNFHPVQVMKTEDEDYGNGYGYEDDEVDPDPNDNDDMV